MDNVCGHARVKRTTRAVCHDVTNPRCHDLLNAKKMTGSSPVMMTNWKFTNLLGSFHGLVVIIDAGTRGHFLLQLFGHQEGKLQGLGRVEARVAEGVVTVI